MTSNTEKYLIDMIARNMAAQVVTRTYSVSNCISVPRKIAMEEALMPGQYNQFDVDDLPEELRDIMKHQEEEIEKKLAIPKELYEKQHYQDQLDSFRERLEIERERQERNDPMKRELLDLRNEVEHLKEGMRKIGILLDTDLPDDQAFAQFAALRKAYGKYKMVEKLTLGEDDES